MLFAGQIPIGYTGQRYDTELGLYHYKARYFHPGLGRFLQPDPVGYKAGMNLYAYCSNDGLNHTDPDGLEESAAEHSLSKALSRPENTPKYWKNIRKLEGDMIEEWRRKDGLENAKRKFEFEQRTPGMGAGTGAFDIKDRINAKRGSPVQVEAARQGNFNFGYHGEKLGDSLGYLQKGAGTAQLINDYYSEYKRKARKLDPTGVIPSGRLFNNLRTQNGDNDPADQKAILDGYNAARAGN